MESEFTTFATANVMVSSITYEAAEKLLPRLEAVDGVHSVEFDATEDHYKNASALFAVTFDGDTTSAVSEAAMDEIKSLLSGYDCYISSDVGNPLEQTIKSEIDVYKRQGQQGRELVVCLAFKRMVQVYGVERSHDALRQPRSQKG